MNAGRGGGAGGDAGSSRQTNATGEPRKPKKKKAKAPPARSSGPIPAPYLAIAPSPVSSTARNALSDLIRPVSNHLVLPSTFVRTRSSSNTNDEPVAAPSPPTARRAYAANLAAPPLIMPGGTSATPRIQELTNPPVRRRGDGRRRSEEALRGMAQANQSMASLGSLGRILESDTASGEAPVQRRRRRVVREEPGRERRPTVSSREEGAAIGLARGASMRRLSVWDGLPDAGEAPPPFIPPAVSNRRSVVPIESPPADDPDDPPPPFEARGRSPPPSWEQATGLAPLGPAVSAPPIAEITLATSEPITPAVSETLPVSVTAPSSPSTEYASAPESQIASVNGNEPTEEEREDRRWWNADISAGYSLTERVERESARRKSRDIRRNSAIGSLAEISTLEETPVPATEPLVVEPVISAPPMGDRSTSPTLAIDSAAEDETATPMVSNVAMGGGLGASISRPGEEVSTPPVSEVTPGAIPSPIAISTQTKSPKSSPLSTSSQLVTEPQSPQPSISSEPSSAVEISKPKSKLPRSKRTSFPRSPLSIPTGKTDIAQSTSSRAATNTSLAPTIEDASSALPAREKQKDKAMPGKKKRVPKVKPVSADTPVSSDAHSAASPSEQVSTEHPTRSPADVEPSAETGLDAPSRPRKASPKGKEKASPSSPPIHIAESIASEAPFSAIQSSSKLAETNPSAREQYQAETYRALTGTPRPSSPSHSPSVSPLPTPLSSTNPPDPFALPVKDPSPSDSDIVIDSTPKRKLTRGKAIRRASSGLSIPTDSILRALASPESPKKPLFEEGQFDWEPAEELRGGDAPPIRPTHKRAASSVAVLRSPPQKTITEEEWTEDTPKRRAHGSVDASFSAFSPVSEVLPPHRQAALKRRELISRSPDLTLTKPDRTPPPIPLIDFSATPPRVAPYQSPPLAIPRDLYQLFDEDEPVAESSAQAAARMEQAAVYKAIKRDRREWAVDEILIKEESPERGPIPPFKRAPPPPPPLRRNLISTTVGANLTPRRSIIRSADSPLTPRPIRQLSVGSQDRPPVLPTRRPAPPPPSKVDDEEELGPPPLPPRPAPMYRPSHDRRHSALSQSDTASSLSESRTIPFNFQSSSASPRRPKGPRPPPPPPRWARIIMPLNDVKSAVRPTSERTQSDSASLIVDHARDSTRRSTSERDLRSSREDSPLEYTDLDVLVSRLEGSGREYEGFSQITAFLGPGKSLAATPEALSTLLPGPISVDSRRVTPQGKVKLKLSLLGVRVTKCPICLGQFKKDEQGVLLPECGHVSHEECAGKWFREDWRCFVCRVPLLKEQGVEMVEQAEGRLEEGVV